MISMDDILQDLAKRRKIFYSESDFQVSLAQRVYEVLPNCKIRIEKPYKIEGKKASIDLWIDTGFAEVVIELKYKTREIECTVGDELYSLKTHSANDISRYDFLKDIMRVETVVSEGRSRRGYAIQLTNDSLYWTQTNHRDTIDSEFRIDEGKILHGSRAWSTRAGAGTTKNRENPIDLKGSYTSRWKDYSEIGGVDSGVFRYLCLPINDDRFVAS